MRRVRVRVFEEMEPQFRVESPVVTDRGAGWRWCSVICNDDGGGKEKVLSSDGRSFQRRGAMMEMALLENL